MASRTRSPRCLTPVEGLVARGHAVLADLLLFRISAGPESACSFSPAVIEGLRLDSSSLLRRVALDGLDHLLRCGLGRARVLAGDEVAVEHDVRDEGQCRLLVERAALLGLRLGVVGDQFVDAGEDLLGSGEARHLAAGDEVGAVGEPGVEQSAVAVADRGDDFDSSKFAARFPEFQVTSYREGVEQILTA